MSKETFTLTDEHIKILRRANVQWEDGAYEGAPCVDIKRPYGNSGGVWRDIAKILGIAPSNPEAIADGAAPHFAKADRERMLRLHRETERALQVVLATASFVPGVYVTTKPYDYSSWALLRPLP